MKPETWVRIRQVFEGAVERSEGERASWLDEACRGEPEVRSEVERLLSEDGSAGGFLEPLAPAAADPRPLAAGARVGSFEIRRVLGSGGMGVVYEAVQDRPRRSVALKTLRHGFGSASRRRRFEFEADVLGSLRHPGIAQVYGAGTHEAEGGSYPYFAMEYVEGARDLLAYAKERGLSQRARVELFAAVCDAVHHGHSKGVVHRDLKPGNVLVDREGRPKVIDFGVARATAPELAASAAETLEGQIVGTLSYMSPEQLTTGEVDTRSDVYSLGCILYELAAGRPPHELEGRPLAEAARVLAEEEPARPAGVPADLAWVAMRCLEKDPERRYASAAELAADLRRFLRSEPVLAGPPTAGYRLARYVRRHRVALGTAAAVVAALGLGLFQARREADAARRALERAEREAQKAEGVSRFLRSMLTSVGPLVLGDEARVIDVLEEAELSLEGELRDQPEARALVRSVLAETYSEMRLLEPAGEHLAEAVAFAEGLPADAPLRLDVMTTRARLAILTGAQADGEAPLRELEELALARHGPGHATTLRVRGTLAELLLILARADAAEGRADEAEARLAEAARRYDAHIATLRELHGPAHGEVIAFLGGRALVWQHQGRLSEARDELERVLALAVEHFPPDHFRIVNARSNLANLHVALGEHERAEPLLRDVLDYVRRRFGDEHVFTVVTLMNLGQCVLETGRADEALGLMEEALELARGLFGEEGAYVARARAGVEAARAAGGEAPRRPR